MPFFFLIMFVTPGGESGLRHGSRRGAMHRRERPPGTGIAVVVSYLASSNSAL